jgi:signal recognition particle subunit SRP72
VDKAWPTQPRSSGGRLQTMAPRSAMHATRPVSSQVTQRPATGGKRKVLPKKEIPLGDRVQRLFTSLCAQIDGSHFTNAIKTCDKGMCSCLAVICSIIVLFLPQVLRLVPDDKDAKQTKLFLLLQTERYSDALALLGDSNQSSVFERAYSSYRLQHLDEAACLLDEIKQRREQNRGALHLEAQLVRSILGRRRHNLSSSFDRTIDKEIIR